jgi:competence protein ComEC
MGPTRALTLRPGIGHWALALRKFAAPAIRVWRVLRWLPEQADAVASRLAGSWIGRLAATFAEAERGRFALWFPVYMGAGVLLYYQLRFEPPAWIGTRFAAGGFATALAVPNRQALRATGFALGFAALGFASAQYATQRLPPIETDLPAKAVIANGTVRSVEILSYARRVTLSGVTLSDDERPSTARSRRRAPPTEVRDDPTPVLRLSRLVRLRLMTGDDQPIATGDTIRVRAMAKPPLPPALPGGWDTQRDAFFAGLGVSGYAIGKVEVTAHGTLSGLAPRIQWLRETIAARITAAIPGAAGAVSVTLLTGASRGIPEADHAAFRASGLAHLLAVAGLHIGIVMAFALGAARTLLALSERASLFWPTKKLAFVFALCVGGLYMLLTGAHVPIVRSFAMACLLTLAILAGRQPISIRGLGLAGIALMLMAPYEVPGVSFQMSFSAVLALISGYEMLRPWLRRLHGRSLAKRLLSYAIALALTSMLAGTASLPYGAWHFGHVQIYYILSNIVAVPVTAFWVMPAGMIALLLMPFGLDWLALVPMGWGAALLIAIARFTAALPAATVAVPHIPAWGLIVLSVGIAWLGLWRSRIRLLGVAAIAAGIVSAAFDRPPDILLSADAGLIGFRTEQRVYLQQTRSGTNFTRDAWFTRWNVGAAASLPGEGTAAAGAFSCERDACLFRPRDGVMPALLVRGPAKPAGCEAASVVVSAEPARAVCPWPSPRPVDRFTVWKDGAVAIWLEPHGALVLTDRADRGDRPWVAPPPKPRRPPVSNLPLAPADR